MVGIACRCICCDGDRLASSPAVLMPFVAKRVFGHEPLEITPEWGLRDLKPGTAYTLCNSLQCQDCGGLFLDYRFTDEQLAALYRGYRDEAYTRERTHYEPGYATVAAHYEGRAAYIADVEKWLSPRLPEGPKVLDWGGADGVNSPFLDRNGLLHVHDISAVKVLSGAQRIGREQLTHHTYDLVACSQVLEHVPNPLNLICEIIPALSARTALYLEVPNEALMREHPGSLKLAPLKRHWHEHINFFTEASLRRLLERAGLQVLDVLDLSIDLGWRKATVMGVLAKLGLQ
jgi:2-polyprenyl-3-methyl-5-hydroxy-6-metoxy-1,4-benzoquinol methylase